VKEDTKILLRIPGQLYEKIKSIAEKEHRSANGQIVFFLQVILANHLLFFKPVKCECKGGDAAPAAPKSRESKIKT